MNGETPEQTMVQLPQYPLAQHVIHQAFESPDEYTYIGVDSDVEYDLYNDAPKIGNIEDVETYTDGNGKTFVRVFSVITGAESRKVRRATRWEPAEWETREVTIGVEATWRPQDSLEPETTLTVEHIDGGFPDPVPEYDKYSEI